MQAYGHEFARVYNAKWANFATKVAPVILNFYESTPIGQRNKSILDLCCGAGHLAAHFLENGYSVLGIDLSENMLHYATENAGRFVESGQARFVQADAGDFSLDDRFGLVVSTYDSLNHLPDERALFKCFQCVFDVSDGYFIFDINTRKGLKNWNSIQVNDGSEDAVIITRGMYDDTNNKAWMRISGFLGVSGGVYRRFEETVFNTAFELERVEKGLLGAGWKQVYFARVEALSIPIPEPEGEPRVFVVARK